MCCSLSLEPLRKKSTHPSQSLPLTGEQFEKVLAPLGAEAMAGWGAQSLQSCSITPCQLQETPWNNPHRLYPFWEENKPAVQAHPSLDALCYCNGEGFPPSRHLAISHLESSVPRLHIKQELATSTTPFRVERGPGALCYSSWKTNTNLSLPYQKNVPGC